MLILLNRRYPVLGAVLSVITGVAFIAIGAATTRSAMMVMGALSLALSVGRAAHKLRRNTPAARP